MSKRYSSNSQSTICYPSCDISLPRIGKMAVSSRLNVCRTPATLTFSIMCDGRRTISTFVAGNQREVRPIGNDYWPLQLRVHFYKILNADAHYAEACVETVRTGNVTCFMNGVLENSLVLDKSKLPFGSSIADCVIYYKTGITFPTVLFYFVLATCLLLIGLSIATILLRKNSKQTQKKFQKNDKFDKPIKISVSPAATEPASYYKFSKIDDRLSVIAEVLEDELSSSIVLPILNSPTNSVFSQNSDIILKKEETTKEKIKLEHSKSESSDYFSRSSFNQDTVISNQSYINSSKSENSSTVSLFNSFNKVKLPQNINQNSLFPLCQDEAFGRTPVLQTFQFSRCSSLSENTKKRPLNFSPKV